MSSLPPASSPVKGQVLCRARSGTLLTFNIKGEKTFVGRDPGVGVSVPLDGISRRHARITFDGKNYWIEDLKSTNGTFLNGEPVQKDRLRHLDVITLGKKADLLFVLRSEEGEVVKRRGIVRAALTPADAPDATPHEVSVGEITLGRSAACNVQAESATVSKVHAQVRRTIDQLVVQDLGSSNGTFVNGNRVMSAELRDGDVLSLGGVESYRIVVELGEVTSASGMYSAAAPVTPPERPRFSNAWKTRFEWDPQELKEIAAAQQAGVAKVAERTLMPKAGVKAPVPAAPKAAPASKPPLESKPPAAVASKPPIAGRPAAPPAGPASQPPPVARPAAPSAGKPTAAPSLPPPSQPPRPAQPAATPRPAATPAPPAPAAARPAAPPPRLEPTVAQEVPSLEPAPAAARTPKTRILEVRLAGSGYDLAVMESGAHNLGRAKDAPLRVDHPTVSRKHARIILGDDRSVAYLQDAGGANGTILNGVALQELKPIQEGDRIRIGEVELVVTLRRA